MIAFARALTSFWRTAGTFADISWNPASFPPPFANVPTYAALENLPAAVSEITDLTDSPTPLNVEFRNTPYCAGCAERYISESTPRTTDFFEVAELAAVANVSPPAIG